MKVRIIVITTAIVFTLFAACGRHDDTISIAEKTNAMCSDGVDNDGDGYTDCADQDCENTSVCREDAGDSHTKDSGPKKDGSSSNVSSNGDAQNEVDAAVCAAQDFPIKAKQATVMLLIDYSSSMATAPETPPHRWAQAVSALTTLLSSSSLTKPIFSFGLDYFPDGSGGAPVDGKIGDCGVSNPVKRDCAPSNQQNVISDLANMPEPPATGNMTPMWCAMNNFNTASYAPGCDSADSEHYMVVISDGSDTCGTDCNCMDTPDTCGDPNFGATDTELGSLAGTLCSNSVKTFVISFGTGGVDSGKLNKIAENGCTAKTSYLEAEDGAALIRVFDDIINAMFPCEYDIAQPDPTKADPALVNFYFDGTSIRRNDDKDCEDGWQWTNDDKTKMKFCKTSCDQLKSGSVNEVKATFGCPTVIK
jgi:hypothetical protein